ncbi:MAG: SusC/RagA family TonB-linked outer membrane protein [Bacteroidales bacterium]
MKKISLLLAFLFMLGTQVILAQSKNMTGTVTDENDEPLPFVTVVVKGTTQGTTTGIDGKFTIGVKDSDILVFSFVGYNTVEVPVANKSTVSVNMKTDSRILDEVMVVAYGTTTKKSFTGSATTVKADKLEKIPVTSFDKALQGNVSGLQVTSSSGQPGSGATVRIRGVGSINASSQPLYVVDGVAINGSNLSAIANSDNGTSTNPLAAINPDDIASYTVLKDASAASLYGSRAANGVVIITTKKGKEGKAKIEAKAQWGFSDRAVKGFDLMNADKFYQMAFQGLANRYNPTVAAGNVESVVGFNPFKVPSGESAILPDGSINPNAKLMVNTDWRDAVYRIGRSEEYSVRATGGNKKMNYFISGGYLNQKGIVKHSDYKRYTTTLNLNAQMNDWLKVGMNNNLSYSEQNTPPGAGGGANPVRMSVLFSRAIPLYKLDPITFEPILKDGQKQYNYSNPVSHDFNPIGIGETDIYKTITARVLSNMYAEATILKDFKAKSVFAIEATGLNETRFYNPEHGNGAGPNGLSAKYRISDITMTSTNTLNYEKQINENHKINVLAGQEAIKNHYDYFTGTKGNFPYPGLDQLIAGSDPKEIEQYFTEWTMMSFFGRVNYDISNKYYLSVSARNDGCSRFGKNYKNGQFYSIGGSWRITEEKFMPDWYWLDDLKLRASYGTSGNAGVGDYAHLGLLTFGDNYNGTPGISFSQLANERLSWERNGNLNIALEFTIFNGINSSIDFYNRTSKDLLLNRPTSLTTGFSSRKENLAEMRNTGIEWNLNTTNFSTGDFVWTTNFNLTYNKNEVTALPQKEIINGTKIWTKGESLYTFYMREWAGVNRNDGRPMWLLNETPENEAEYIKTYSGVEGTDQKVYVYNGKVVTSDYSLAQKAKVGDALPKFYGGLSNSFSYKGFDLDFLLYFSIGGNVYNSTEAALSHGGKTIGQNLLASQANSWTPENPDADNPEYLYGNPYNPAGRSTRFLHDASYLRLKNITLGYNIPRSFLSRIGISNAKVYVQANNVFTVSGLKGIDPEQALTGLTSYNIPITKSINFGINLGI